MTSQGLNFLHAWVLPEDDLVQRVAVGANDFMSSLREHQVTDLGASVDGVKRL